MDFCKCYEYDIKGKYEYDIKGKYEYDIKGKYFFLLHGVFLNSSRFIYLRTFLFKGLQDFLSFLQETLYFLVLSRIYTVMGNIKFKLRSIFPYQYIPIYSRY